jgi:hypothetical protein
MAIEGLKDAEWILQQFINEVPAATTKGLIDATNHIFAKAVEYAPIDKGPLRESGYTVIGGANSPDGQMIAYGTEDGGIVAIHGGDTAGADTAVTIFDEKYAAAQHEHTEYNHPKGGRAKYLEAAALDAGDGALLAMANAIDDDLKGMS